MFGRNKLIKELELQKGMIAEFEFQVTQQNEMYQALYSFLSSGVSLSKDSKMKDYVREGYEGNSDLFSIISKLAGMFAGVPLQPMILKGDKYEEIENEEIARLMTRTNYYQTWNEFKKHWIISAYVTGNMITYAPKFTAGLNNGKITEDGLIVMPAQNVNIEASGWRKPIGHYTLDIDQSYKIACEDVWHERFAPTLTYEQGQNFMGQAPLKTAREYINAQNAGIEFTAKTYKKGHPSSIISKEVADNDIGGASDEQVKKFRSTWKDHHQGPDNSQIPVFTLGKVEVHKISFENLRELQIIEMSEHGLRKFCNILQVPAQLFNDTAASTYNNQLLAQKAIYTNRIIPDINTFCEGFNGILKAYGDIILRPDFSGIEALQQEKKEKVEWVSRMHNDGVITGDQYLEMIGEEPTGLPEMQVRYINANKIPLNFSEGDDIERSDKFYEQYELQNAM